MNSELVNDCSCLDKKNIFLYYPYFANTFLLNYSIKYEGLLGDNADSKIIKWDRESLIDTLNKEKDSDKDILIFFATKRMLEDKFFLSANIEEFDFSLYLPRFVFIPFSIEAYRSCYSGKNFEDKYSSLIDAFKEDFSEIPSINDESIKAYLKHFKLSETIFSDTPEEAYKIAEKLKTLNCFSKDDVSPELKLLYYGAPYAINLLNMYPEFLPIRIDSIDLAKESELQKYFDTKIVIYCKSLNKCECKDRCIVKEKIKNFHKIIFDKAKENPKTLAEIYNRFVQENHEQIPYQIFQNVECFSKAITYHHKYTTQTVGNEIRAFTSALKDLSTLDYKFDYRTYIQSRQSFKEYALAYYILLVFHYIINNEKNLQKFSFKEIASSLRDKAFLNGKYYLLFQSIIKTLYAKFLFEINDTNNPIKVFCSEHNLDVESKMIYYQFKDDIVEEVNNKAKEISLSDAFNFLIRALGFILNKDSISALSNNIEREIEHTVLEISDIKSVILENYDESSLFDTQQRRKIKTIKKQIEKKINKTKSSIQKPNTGKI
jgi:hypothetical protein